jgi:hypothetical protein
MALPAAKEAVNVGTSRVRLMLYGGPFWAARIASERLETDQWAM